MNRAECDVVLTCAAAPPVSRGGGKRGGFGGKNPKGLRISTGEDEVVDGSADSAIARAAKRINFGSVLGRVRNT